MHLHTRLTSCLALIAAAGIASAAEGTLSDLRLEGSLLPEDYDYTAEGSVLGIPVSVSDDSSFDDAYRIGIAGQSLFRHGRAPIGFSAGGAIAYHRLQNDGDIEERYEALTVTARLGLGITLGDLFHVEVLPFVGAGPARGEVGGEESDDFSLYWEYGIMAGAFLTLANSLQLGVHAGWMHGEWDLDFDSRDDGVDVLDDVSTDLEHEGLFVGLSVGVRI